MKTRSHPTSRHDPAGRLHRLHRLQLGLLLAGLAATAGIAPASPLRAQQPATIADATRGMERRDGFIPLYWDRPRGRLLLEIARLDAEFLYLRSLATGIGIGGEDIDRGLVGDDALARFERVGPKVYLVLQNPRFRSTSDDEALARSVRESFPTSVVGSFDVIADEGGRVVVDATSFFMSDAMNVRGQLRQAGEGTYQVDRERSAIALDRTKAFPRNTEVEATITFTTDQPGPRVSRHAPEARHVSVREHHSFVMLPEPGYRPRSFDPRVGLFSVSWYDFSRPFDQDYVTRWAMRHRLVKRTPGAAPSEPVAPIVYYLDRGVPEPYRAAFKEGAMWWARAFEAAGFIDAFRVEDMPADMDPLDARYNVIQWVHRTTPSSSWGSSFVDPRTGEIIKAAVRMDSHRSLVDFNIFAAAVPAMAANVLATAADTFVITRRRQHSAHEVGHTLGLAHNFIAHSYGGRASAMDYPPPKLDLVNGRIDVSDAYSRGLGAYDTLAIRWAYAEFDPASEARELDAIAREGLRKGYRFITNSDEVASGSYPEATTWTLGEDPIAELQRVMAVRRVLVDRFDERAIRPGEPMALLNQRFVTAYLHHRYSLGAAIKAVGGMEFRYTLRGDSLDATKIVDPARQRRALELLLDAIQPAELAIPERVLALMAPRPFGYENDPRGFQSAAAPAFDQVGVARTLATMVVRDLLAPQRVARLVAFADRDREAPSATEVIGRLVDRTWGAPRAAEAAPARETALSRVPERVVVDELLGLASDTTATAESRAAAEWGLRRVLARLGANPAAGGRGEGAAHREAVRAEVERFFRREFERGRAPVTRRPPPGTPIGEPVP